MNRASKFNSVFFFLLLCSLVMALTSCSAGSTPASSTSQVITSSTPAEESPTTIMQSEPTATRSPSPTAKPQPTATRESEISKAWSIKTGDLTNVGVASDGTVYGVNRQLYAVISNKGEVIKTTEVDLSNCLRGVRGGSGAPAVSEWFITKPDGTLQSDAYRTSNGPCIISPGDPPNVTVLDQHVVFLPYADDAEPHRRPAVPEGYELHRGITGSPDDYWIDRRENLGFFLNPQLKLAGYISRNGKFQSFKLPDDFDVKKSLPSLRVKVMPWDDVYYTYKTYDALGNAGDNKFVKVKADGSSTSLSNLPELLSEAPVTYLPSRNEIYFTQSDWLVRYDLDFKELSRFKLPEEVVNTAEFRERSGSRSGLFIGNDVALYLFDAASKTLTKYLIVEAQ